jgi:hypothetical protein
MVHDSYYGHMWIGPEEWEDGSDLPTDYDTICSTHRTAVQKIREEAESKDKKEDG